MRVALQTEPKRLDFIVGGERFTSYFSHSEPPGFDALTAPGRRAVTQALETAGVSVTFTHGNVNGFDFTTCARSTEPQTGRGRIVSEEISARRGAVSVGFRQTCGWIAPDGRRILSDTRTIRVFPTGSEGRVIDFAIHLMPPDRDPVVLGRSEAGLLCVRAAPTLCVSGGGQLRNSLGDYGPASVHGKSAAWCAYVGVVERETVGFLLLDHPENPGHPAHWRAHENGLLTPCVSGWGAVEIPPGRGLSLRYRLHVYRGYVDAGWGDARLEDYRREDHS